MKFTDVLIKTIDGKPLRLVLPSSTIPSNHAGESSSASDYSKDREILLRWLQEQQPSEIMIPNEKLPSTLLHQIIESSFQNTNLRVLNFRSSQLNQLNLQLLIHLLRRNRSIETIDLFHCLQLFPATTPAAAAFATSQQGNGGIGLSPALSSLLNELLQLFADSRYLRSICGCTVAKPTLSLTKPVTASEMDFIYAELKKNYDLKILLLCCYHSMESILLSLMNNQSLIQLILYDIESFDYQQASSGSLFTGNNRKNTTLKTLQLKFSPHMLSSSSSHCLHWLANYLIPLLSGVTTLQIDYLPLEDYSIQFLCDILQKNQGLLHLELFNIQWNWINWKKLTQCLSENRSLRILRLDANNEVDHRSRQVLAKALENRNSPLILRVGDTEKIFGDMQGRHSADEWEVGDCIEAIVNSNGDEWAPAIVIAVLEDFKYNVQFKSSGAIKMNCRSDLLRRGNQFARPNSIDISYLANDNVLSQIEEAVGPKFKPNQEVLARFYGDNIWYHAVVVNYKGNGVVDLKFDDGEIYPEVEEHLIQTNIPYASSETDLNNNFYDTGIYQRGDYVEIKAASDNSWKRGRIASDKKNGSYDIRLENGQDEVCRGRAMRFHFRSKDPVDIRLAGLAVWKTGQILKQEKNGSYVVQYDENNQEERNVDPKRLMPVSRHVIRQRSVEFAKKLDEVIQSSQITALKYSDASQIAPQPKDSVLPKPIQPMQMQANSVPSSLEKRIYEEERNGINPYPPLQQEKRNNVGNNEEFENISNANVRKINRRQLRQQEQQGNYQNNPTSNEGGTILRENLQPHPPQQEKKFTSPRVVPDRATVDRDGVNRYDISPPNEKDNVVQNQLTPYQQYPQYYGGGTLDHPQASQYSAPVQMLPAIQQPAALYGIINVNGGYNPNPDVYRNPYAPTSAPNLANPPMLQAAGVGSQIFQRQGIISFAIGERVNLLIDELNGQYQQCYVHSINPDNSLNLMSYSGNIINQVDSRYVQKLPLENPNANLHSFTTPIQQPAPIITTHSASHQMQPHTAGFALPQSAPPKFNNVSSNSSKPSSAGTPLPAAVLEKKSHYKNGIKVLVEVEINAYESITMEGSVVRYHGDGLYSVLLNHEQDERLVDESLITPVSMSQNTVGGVSSLSINDSKAKVSELKNPEETKIPNVSAVVATSKDTTEDKVGVTNNARLHKDVVRDEAETSNTMVRKRHALSYIGGDEKLRMSQEEEDDDDEEEGIDPNKVNIFEPEFPRVASMMKEPASIVSKTKQLPYSVGMNVCYQPPGQNKSYTGTIQSINAEEQTVSLLLEFGNYIHHIHFHQLIPYNIPGQFQPKGLQSNETPPRISLPKNGVEDGNDGLGTVSEENQKEDPLPPGLRPPPLSGLQTPQKPSQGKKSNQFQRKNVTTTFSPTVDVYSPTQSNATTELPKSVSSSPVERARSSSIGVVGTGAYQFIVYYNHNHSPAVSGNWNEMIVYCHYSNRKVMKVRQFHIHLLLGNPSSPFGTEGGLDADIAENMIEYFVMEDHLALNRIMSFSEDVIPFPHISEKDYLTICWRIKQNNYTSAFLNTITNLKIVMFEKMKATAYGEVPLRTNTTNDSSMNSQGHYQHVALLPISSEKRQVIDFITTAATTNAGTGKERDEGANSVLQPQLIIHEEIVSQILLPIWELDKLSTLSDLETRFPLFLSLLRENNNQQRKKPSSIVLRPQQRVQLLEKKLTFVNILLPSHQHISSKVTNFQRIYQRFFQHYYCVLSFHYYQPTSNPLTNAITPNAKKVDSNMKYTILSNLHTLYQSITQNMKLSLFFIFLPVSLASNTVATTTTRGNVPNNNSNNNNNPPPNARRVLTENDLYSSMGNLFQHMIHSATRSPENSMKGGEFPNGAAQGVSSIVQDVLTELQFWNMECLNLKSIQSSATSNDPPRIIGIKWKYYLQLLPYFKLILVFLIVQQLILEPSSPPGPPSSSNVTPTTTTGRKTSRARTRSEDYKDANREGGGEQSLYYATSEYDDEWLITLWNQYQQRYSYTLGALVFYYELLSMMEGFLTSLPSASNGSGGLSSQQQRVTLSLLEELITSTQLIHNKISQLESPVSPAASASGSNNKKDRLMAFCWEELLPKFFLTYSSYLIGNKLHELLLQVLSLLWERSKTVPATGITLDGQPNLSTNVVNQPNRKKSKNSNIFESLQMYCIALPQRLALLPSLPKDGTTPSSAVAAAVTPVESKGRKYLLYYSTKEYHDDVLLPFLQSLRVPIHTHNQSNHFLSIRDYPFTLPDEFAEILAGNDEKYGGGIIGNNGDRRRSRSHSHHRHRSRTRSQNLLNSTTSSPRTQSLSNSGEDSSREQSRSRTSSNKEPLKPEVTTTNTQSVDNTTGGEYYSLQEQFIEQLIIQLALQPPNNATGGGNSVQLQAAKQQLTQITNQFMKQGIYCLEDLLQLPTLLLSQPSTSSSEANGKSNSNNNNNNYMNKPSSSRTSLDEKCEQLTTLLMKFFQDLEISKFYQLKLVHYLVQQYSLTATTATTPAMTISNTIPQRR